MNKIKRVFMRYSIDSISWGSKKIPILLYSFLIIVFTNKRNIHSFSEILILFVFLKKTNKMWSVYIPIKYYISSIYIPFFIDSQTN